MKIRLDKILIFFTFTLIGINVFGQNSKSSKLEKVIIKIEKQEFLFRDYELKKRSLKIGNRLNKLASESDLLKLSKRNCKLCFSYSFWTLSKRNSKLIHKIYSEFEKKEENEKFEIVNEHSRKNKSCLKILISENNFIYDIYKKGKYLNELK